MNHEGQVSILLLMIFHTAQIAVSSNGLAAELGRSSGGGLEFRVFCVPMILDAVLSLKEKEEMMEQEVNSRASFNSHDVIVFLRYETSVI